MIAKINDVIGNYFAQHPDKEWIPVKSIMPDLVKAGVFNKDVKKGMPFRKVLLALNSAGELDKIPFVHAEKKEESIYWYLVREGGKFQAKESTNLPPKNPKKEYEKGIKDNDYLIELCDQILNKKSQKQFTFNDLLGDFHKDGISRTKLPLDAYYKEMNLVVEVVNKKSSTLQKDIDKSQKLTVSGVTREEQRKIYQERKRTFLEEKEIKVFEINFALFETDEENRLIRSETNDLALLKELLQEFI